MFPRPVRFVLAASQLVLTACPIYTGRKQPGVEMPGDGRETGLLRKTNKTAVTGMAKKEVFGKREPVTLISKDKTECTVPEPKFRETAVGEKVRCEWRTP